MYVYTYIHIYIHTDMYVRDDVLGGGGELYKKAAIDASIGASGPLYIYTHTYVYIYIYICMYI